MSSTQGETKRGKGYTAPKGRPTTHSVGDVKRSRLSPTMEWILAILAIVAVLGAIFYFGSDWGRGGGGQNGTDVPETEPIVLVVDVA